MPARSDCMFAEMDKMVGGDSEKGLAGMKKVAEAQASPAQAAAR